jgi:large subunit ribosomal protein L15
MNSLHNLPQIVDRSKKRVGRGAGTGKGAKSGRGTTRHQAARENIPLHFEGGQGRFMKKFPLLRGKGRNRSYNAINTVITLADLNLFKDGETVTADALIEKKIIIKNESKAIKVLANGTLEKKLIVSLAVSQAAKTAIEKLGGEVKSI